MFKDKAFRSKAKDYIIKILLARQSKVCQAVKPKDKAKDQDNDVPLDQLVRTSSVMKDMILKANTSSEETLDAILRKCTEILEEVIKLHNRLDKHSSQCIAVDGTLKLLQKIADKVYSAEMKEEFQEPTFQCSYCETDNHKLTDCFEKVRCLKCGLFILKQESCGWDKKSTTAENMSIKQDSMTS